MGVAVALRDQGLSVLPIDHRVRCTDLQVLRLDLQDAQDVSVFLEMLATANVCLAHFGPPCGTSSRARERPLPKELSHLEAPPLRSDARKLLGCMLPINCTCSQSSQSGSCTRVGRWLAVKIPPRRSSGGSQIFWHRSCRTLREPVFMQAVHCGGRQSREGDRPRADGGGSEEAASDHWGDSVPFPSF